MPHIDDGILHAHLDGALPALSDAGELPDGMSAADVVAHLSACADCRARLEAERSIREQAGLVLRDVALADSVMPPFADIAGAPVALPRSRPRRWMPLTWAATVLLAIGAGWWGSALWRAQDLTEMAALESEQSRAALSEPAPGAADATTAESDAVPPSEARADAAQSLASPDASSRDVASRDDPSRDGVSRDDPSRPGAAQADAGVVVADALAPSVTSQAGSANTAAARPAEPIGMVAAISDSAERAAAGNPSSSGVPSRELAAGDVRSLTPAADAMRLMQRVEEHVAVSPDRPLYVTTSDDLGTFAGMLAREQAGRMPFVRVSATDSDELRQQLFFIADASTPVIEMAKEIGQTTVRVRQTLSSGEPVEVVSWKQVTLMLNELVAASAADDAERDSAAALRQRRKALTPTPRPAPAAAASPPVVVVPPPPPPPGAQQSRAEEDYRRSSAAAKALTDRTSPAFLVSTDPPRTLPDGRRELVLRSSSGPLWIAIRASLSPAALLDLVPRLTQTDPDGR